MRLRLLLIMCLASAALPFAVARAVAPLATDTLLFDSNRTGNFELFRTTTSGGAVTQLTSDSAHDSFWPKISPDRTKLLLTRTPKGTHDLDYTKASTWVMNVDGTGLTRILDVGAHGWGLQGHPEWSPDGTKLAMVGGVSPNYQIFITNADGSAPMRLTSDGLGGPRPGTHIDPSWAPDGQSLLFVGCPMAICTERQYEVYKINANGTGETRLTDDLFPDYDPYWAPDAMSIAWLRNTGTILQWGVFGMLGDGSNEHAIIDDGGINSKPDWSADSSTIFFHKTPKPFGGSSGFNLWKINPDGSGLARVLPDHGGAFDNEYPDAVSFAGSATASPSPSPTPSIAPPSGPPSLLPGFAAPYIGSIDSQTPQIRSSNPVDRHDLAHRYRRLSDAGLRWAYAWVQWSDNNPAPDVYLWDQVDTRVRAAHDVGINLLMQVQTGDWSLPQLWAGPTRVNPRKPLSPTAAYEDMTPVIDFWRTLVNRYKPGGVFAQQEGWTDGYGVSAWEVENEPDSLPWWGNWRAVPDDYAEYLSKIYPVVKAQDPTAVIAAPGLSQQGTDGPAGPAGVEWLDDMLSTAPTENQSDTYRASGAALGGGPFVDTYSWHFDTAPISDFSVPARAQRIIDTIAKYRSQPTYPTRADAQLWFTEGGVLQYETDEHKFANGQLQLAAQLHGVGVRKILTEGGTQSSNDQWPTKPYYRALKALTRFFPDAGTVVRDDFDPRVTAYRRTDPVTGAFTWILWADDLPAGTTAAAPPPFALTVPTRTAQVDVTDVEFVSARGSSSTVTLQAGDPSPVVIVAEVYVAPTPTPTKKKPKPR